MTGLLLGYSEFRAITKDAIDSHLDTPPSMEHVFHGSMANIKPSSLTGDSGSAVYTREGLLMGIVSTEYALTQSSEEHGYTFVTPIEDILEDIKAFTGVIDVRLAPE